MWFWDHPSVPPRRPLPQQAEATEETDLGEDAELHPAPERLCDHNATRDQTESPSGQRAVIPGNQRRLGGGRTSSYSTAIIIEPPPPKKMEHGGRHAIREPFP